MYDFGQYADSNPVKTGTILIVDDDEDILTASRLLLRREFGVIKTCNNPREISALFAESDFDVVLLDMNFGPGESSGKEGLVWLEKILSLDPDAVVVMITAHGSLNTAVAAMKLGATDFIAKPWQNEKVVATVSTALKLRQSRKEAQTLRQTNKVLLEETMTTDGQIIGESAEAKKVMTVVSRAGPTEFRAPSRPCAESSSAGQHRTPLQQTVRDLRGASRSASGNATWILPTPFASLPAQRLNLEEKPDGDPPSTSIALAPCQATLFD